jgi:hypothetical protein
VTDAEFRNPQELASIWGDTGPEVRKLGSNIGIVDTYALLDRCDFLLVFEGSRSRRGVRTLLGRRTSETEHDDDGGRSDRALRGVR